MTLRVDKGGALEIQFDESNISIEYIKPGFNLPEWLLNYQLELAKWNNTEDNTNARIMVIYSNEESRKQALEELNQSCKIPIDSSLHLTIPRLIDALHSDLRLPKLIKEDGILFEMIHLNCVKISSNHGFPLFHSNVNIKWSRAKTKIMNQLYTRICEEKYPHNWEEDPGIIEFENILKIVERQMSGTHPNLRIKKIINILMKNDNIELFSLRDIDGIIIQDLPPTLSTAKLKLLQLVSNFKQIHQLCNPGSFRLGEHGAYLADVEICKSIQSLPDWVPKHELEYHQEKSEIYHLGLFNSSQLDEAIHNILSEYISTNSRIRDLIIVDSRTKDNRKKWPRLFESLGIKLDFDEMQESDFAGLSWLEELMKIGQGPNAWSCSKLKKILNQNYFSFVDDYLFSKNHPTNYDYFPIADDKLLEETARTFHILGGRNSLNDWLYALSRENFEDPFVDQEVQRKIREQTQWWLLSIANFLYPLLSKSDREALDNLDYYLGCNSKSMLPRFNFIDSGDKWLHYVVKNLNWDNWMDNKSTNSSIVALQRLINQHRNLRKIQTSVGFIPPFDGDLWIEETVELLNSIRLSKTNISDKSIRILTPENALGCNAEIVIFIGLGNDDWDLSMPFFPLLDSRKLKEAGLLNPDKKIREARHYFNHIMCSGKEILLLDPTVDPKIYPSTPFAEWYNKTDGIETKLPNWLKNNKKSWIKQKVKDREIFTFTPEKIIWTENSFVTSYLGSTNRSIKQSNGIIRREQKKNVPLLNPESPFLIYENELLEDRIKREPLGLGIKEDYLDWSERLDYVSNYNLKLIPPKKLSSRISSPREYRKWPIIGKKINSINSTVSIDPRPLEIKPSGIEILDKRSGNADFIDIKKEILWSTSKLNKWIQCPRRGWLESELYLDKDDLIDEDLDFRTRGKTLHESFAELICKNLDFQIGSQRQDISLKNLSKLDLSIEKLMSDFVKILSIKTPWIWRKDAMAVHRRNDFIGMTLLEFEKWWENECPPISPIGRLGQMLVSEYSINDSINLAFEWKIDKNKPILINLLDEKDSDNISLRGWIDRVDLVPFKDGSFYDESGDNTVAPFFLNKWKPKRLILIRDIKSVEGPNKDKIGQKHEKGIFEDIQLALYARAWEIANPGDLVIGVGISEVGDFTKHYLELDPEYKSDLDSMNLGIITSLTNDIYRMPNESIPANSNPFRAWLFWKIKTAIKASKFAKEGFVHPTPGDFCSHCGVKNICRLKRG